MRQKSTPRERPNKRDENRLESSELPFFEQDLGDGEKSQFTNAGHSAVKQQRVHQSERLAQDESGIHNQEKALPPLNIKEGDVLTDTEQHVKYHIERKVGEGGFGAVFRVKDERTGMIKAIKFIHPDYQGDEALEARFKREIDALATMNNPFILVACDVVHVDIQGKRVTGFVTDFIDGPNLHEELEFVTKLNPEAVVILSAQLTFALESIRKAGFVHRDLKPENIFIDYVDVGTKEEKFVRIGDFGIVGFAEEPKTDSSQHKTHTQRPLREHRLTEDGMVIGSPMTISPEAALGNPPDHRSDLYSLGVVMYEMVTGRLPFKSENTRELLASHVMDRPPTFEMVHVKDIPVWLEDIIFTLLEKDPEDRYQTAREVFDALRAGVKADQHYRHLLNEIPFIWWEKQTDAQKFEFTDVQKAA